jgi:hypothetical protein
MRTKKDSVIGKPKNKYPGPGSYGNKILSKGPSYGFGSSRRIKEYDDTGPAPGSYKIPSKFSETQKFAVPTQAEEFRFV